jgi:hypothetical protein
VKEYDGVTGKMIFDLTHNNLAPVTGAAVKGERFVFRPAPAR